MPDRKRKRRPSAKSGNAVYQFSVKDLKPRRGRRGQQFTVATLSVEHVVIGPKLETIRFVRSGRPPKFVSVGAKGFAKIAPDELKLLTASDEPPPSTNFLAGVIWFFTGIADAPAPPPGGGGGIPDKPGEEPPEEVPDDPMEPIEPAPPPPPAGGGGSGPGDIGGGGFGNDQELAEHMCDGAGDGSFGDFEECMDYMTDYETTLRGGGTDDPESGGFTGGADTGGGGDTGDQDTGDYRAW